MTINKSQRQSLKNVGIYLLSHVFSYGQLYIAISRVPLRDSDNHDRPIARQGWARPPGLKIFGAQIYFFNYKT